MIVCVEPSWDHESFMYLKRLPTAYDSWGSNWPLAQPTATTQNSCPTMLISPERFHPKHAVIFATKNSRRNLPWDSPRLPCDEIWTKAAMEKWWFFKQIGNGNFRVTVWKIKTRRFQTWKQEIMYVFFWLQNESVSKLAGGSKGNATP